MACCQCGNIGDIVNRVRNAISLWDPKETLALDRSLSYRFVDATAKHLVELERLEKRMFKSL